MSNEPGYAPETATPLDDFSQAHAGILGRLKTLEALPPLIQSAAQLRELCSNLLYFFEDVILHHHQEEERELFTAVMASAQKGDELARVKRIVDQLTDEHRDVEAKWKRLRPAIQKLARGQDADLDPVVVADLIAQYEAHARFEETEFMPLSQLILGRNENHLSALAMSMHMRRNPRNSLEAANWAARQRRMGA